MNTEITIAGFLIGLLSGYIGYSAYRHFNKDAIHIQRTTTHGGDYRDISIKMQYLSKLFFGTMDKMDERHVRNNERMDGMDKSIYEINQRINELEKLREEVRSMININSLNNSRIEQIIKELE